MEDWFYNDLHSNFNRKWEDLIVEIKSIDTYTPICKNENFYEIFKHIIVSLVLDQEIILLDSDFSNEEVNRVLGNEEVKYPIISLEGNQIDINSKQELLNCINENHPNWSITLFTSGTTGVPKKIKHIFKTIVRFVKTGTKYENNIWGFAYNPTHMAGVQVFFQAILNGNQIIRLFGLSNEEIYQSIKKYHITNISATPTFYRLLLPSSLTFNSIKKITSGGEKFDNHIIKSIQSVFPNAKITNVYASTEAGTLLAADGDIFAIKPNFENLIRIENNEIIIHKNLLGINEQITEDWYKTGDLIEIVSTTPLKFKFLSRKSEMINVGGYKVNPNEVEETIRNFPDISDVRVYAKSNSVLGNIICCEIVSSNKNLEESTLRHFLQEKLQEFKIPRIMNFVSEISTTRTGKIKRN